MKSPTEMVPARRGISASSRGNTGRENTWSEKASPGGETSSDGALATDTRRVSSAGLRFPERYRYELGWGELDTTSKPLTQGRMIRGGFTTKEEVQATR